MTISTGNGIPRTKEIGAIDYLLRTCNNRHDILDVVDKLLSKMSDVNIKKSITHVFDDSNIEFDLIKKLLTHAEKSGMDVQELINHRDPYTRQSAMHILMRSNLTDNITDDLNYLLSKGGDILSKYRSFSLIELKIFMYFLKFLEKGKPLSNNEYELPVHIATNLQYISDEDPNSAT